MKIELVVHLNERLQFQAEFDTALSIEELFAAWKDLVSKEPNPQDYGELRVVKVEDSPISLSEFAKRWADLEARMTEEEAD